MIRIGIAEDQALVRESLAIVLNLQPDVQVRWTTENGADTVYRVAEDPVDLVLMDLRMPGMDGVSAMKTISKQHPDIKMVVLTTFHHDEWIIDAMNAGAVACFLKEIPPQMLIDAIRLILSGDWDPEGWTADWRKYAPEVQFHLQLQRDSTADLLTPRELNVLRALCEGKSNAEIGASLYLTEGTVKNYVSGIYHKLGVSHRAAAIRFARDHGIY